MEIPEGLKPPKPWALGSTLSTQSGASINDILSQENLTNKELNINNHNSEATSNVSSNSYNNDKSS
ncbi:hypothetical protein BB558_002917 [Smittium angustum]|uniref:Uncharacterized protein n=1 Tax=Smittium angustum TaxID=133377 RepID=A0A2U1J7F0_SMIAN|nr:hypothetical protein BB558_002917 [Smittium angustum]